MVHEDDPTVADDTSDTIEDGSPGDGPAPPHQIVIHTDDGLPRSGERLGRYELGEVIGRGGMGIVFRARDPELDRPLAIKVVLPATDSKRSQQRLLDEARAMAKLRHPAVVPVFDVGETHRGIYVVMPLLGGGTLRSWAESERRPWRAVLERYLVAGRGLAAAHAAGLVHRDFKPGNVLLGDAGEVMVGDFGLAADTDIPSPSQETTAQASPAHVPTSVGGTPAYMAPEHAAGAPVDARADQFSFCISLWEGLHGERPAEAATRAGSAVSTALPAVPADRRGSPRWLLTAIARGWQAAPERRWPSMTALLDHIERRLHRARRVALGGAAFGVLGIAAAVVWMSPTKRENPCPDPRSRVAVAWNPDIRARIEAAFRATGRPAAREVFERLAPSLDHYANEWRSKHIEVCRAGSIEKTQSTELLDRRMSCFDRSLAELASFTSTLAAADAAVVNRAIDGVEQLSAVADCVDPSLVNTLPLPSSPAQRARILDLDRRIAALRASSLRGEPGATLRASEALAAEARTMNYPPVLARALEMNLFALRASELASDKIAHDLADAAAAARDDVLLAGTWTRLLTELARQGRFDEALAVQTTARTAVKRIGAPASHMFELEHAMAALEQARGDIVAAEPHIRAALDLAPTDRERRIALITLSSILLQARRAKEARTIAEQAVALTEITHGRKHPEMSKPLLTLGLAHQMSGNPDDIPNARRALQEALELRIAAYDEQNILVAQALTELAGLELAVGNFVEAERLARRGVAITDKTPDPTRVTVQLQRLAGALASQGKLEEARPYYERALDAAAKVGGTENRRYAGAEINLANRLLELEDYAAARRRAAHAASVFEKAGDASGQALSLRVIATCDAHEGRIDDAIIALEHAVTLCSGPGCSPGNLEAIKFALAEQLVASGDHARALKLAQEVRDGLVKIGRTGDLAELDAWMKKHGGRPRR